MFLQRRVPNVCVIAGIKKSLFNVESLVAYLLDRLNNLNPKSLLFVPSERFSGLMSTFIAPAYLSLLKEGALPVSDPEVFISALAARLGMIQKGGEPDFERASDYFIKWWREGGAIGVAAEARGWGLDFDFGEPVGFGREKSSEKIQEIVDRHVEEMKRDGGMGVSLRQTKLEERRGRARERLERRAASPRTPGS